MIDPKKTIRKILREYGHDILIQRRLSDDFLYSDTFERYTTRSRVPRTSELPNSKEEKPEGIVTSVDLIFYFEASVNPNQGDRIYEESPVSIDGSNIFVIDEVLPVRGRLGHIAYWIVGASRERPS